MDAPQATLPPDLSADLPAPLAERIAKLAPDQRAAATAPPGPVLCIAPAGSGKTTTLVARIAWLIGGPVRAEPATVMAITFNKRAQEEMAARLGPALEPLGVDAAAVRVRTFHALGREILLDAGAAVEPLVERAILLAELLPEATVPDWRRLLDLLEERTGRRYDDLWRRLEKAKGLQIFTSQAEGKHAQ